MYLVTCLQRRYWTLHQRQKDVTASLQLEASPLLEPTIQILTMSRENPKRTVITVYLHYNEANTSETKESSQTITKQNHKQTHVLPQPCCKDLISLYQSETISEF